jgi:hypothetical protein
MDSEEVLFLWELGLDREDGKKTATDDSEALRNNSRLLFFKFIHGTLQTGKQENITEGERHSKRTFYLIND